jgi:hypothetical protein
MQPTAVDCSMLQHQQQCRRRSSACGLRRATPVRQLMLSTSCTQCVDSLCLPISGERTLRAFIIKVETWLRACSTCTNLCCFTRVPPRGHGHLRAHKACIMHCNSYSSNHILGLAATVNTAFRGFPTTAHTHQTHPGHGRAPSSTTVQQQEWPRVLLHIVRAVPAVNTYSLLRCHTVSCKQSTVTACCQGSGLVQSVHVLAPTVPSCCPVNCHTTGSCS